MKKILLSLSVIILILSACLVTITNSDTSTKVEEKIEENLDKSAIRISKADENLFDFNSKNFKTTYQEKNKSVLEERTSPYIKKVDFRNGLFAQRFYIYDKPKIESVILNFLNEELVDQTQNFIKKEDKFSDEVNFIKNYLNIDNLHEDYHLQDEIGKLFLEKVRVSKDVEVNYLSETAWKEYRPDIVRETNPNYFSQIINGYSEVYTFSQDITWGLVQIILAQAITKVIKGALLIGGTTSVTIPLISMMFQKLGIVLIDEVLTISKILAWISSKAFKIFTKISIEDIIVDIIEFEKLKPILDNNKDILLEKYGEDVWNKYQDYFLDGFDNGINGKWNSLFGGTSVKDRGIIIFDNNRNQLWNLKSIDTKSTAKFREWLPWLTYTKNNQGTHTISQSKKIVMYTASIATQQTWTGTYYGYIDNPMSTYYDLDWSANWLEWTRLQMYPNFVKKTDSTTKSMFISENLKDTKDFAKYYQINEKDLESNIDPRERDLLSKYPTTATSVASRYSLMSKVFQ